MDVADVNSDTDSDAVNDGSFAESAWLLTDNAHPPEYYYAEDYSPGATLLLDLIEEQWFYFFDWMLNQKIGKGGRRMRGTKHRTTGDKITGQVNCGMHKVLHKLAKKHGLREQGREKPCMYVEDLKEVLRTNLTTTRKRYSYGQLRMQMRIFMQLAGNTFLIPEIVYDPSLIFSPHVTLLSIMFNDQAFAPPSLTCPRKLSRLDIELGSNQLPLHFKEERLNQPLFRRAKGILHCWTISADRPLTYAFLNLGMKSIGQITRPKQVTCTYALRYGAGKAFNEGSKVSEAVQNPMMQHADIQTFLRPHLHRLVTADTAAIIELDPQESVMLSTFNMSRWIDPDRLWGLTAEQAEYMNNAPVILSLTQRRVKLKQRLQRKAIEHPKYKALVRRVANEKERLRATLLAEIQEIYERGQPVRIIERHLAGVKLNSEPKVASYFSEDTLPGQRRLTETMILAPPVAALEEELERRNNAITAVTAYCKIEEGDMCERRKLNEDPPSPADEALKVAMLSVCTTDQQGRPTICFMPGDLSKHFNKKHLKRVEENEDPECKICRCR
ncbi:hypothetical protein BDY21DRAFT_396397 [Lineolata rhizophorae]|uniref:Uncharacterized protein n=1 Tax=Lineolata rhizophorae TaxID=578093 RepID=A0A6A6NUH8_9PEZI|nr:hypothetical protein BDY21DRAFT_396397 [Lineolata rhizophorae]